MSTVRPGPDRIEPGQCPDGVVIRVYAVPSGTLVIEQKLGPDDDIEGAAIAAAILAEGSDGWAACLVAFDGDSGERASLREWLAGRP